MSKPTFISHVSETKEILKLELKAFVLLLINTGPLSWDTRYNLSKLFSTLLRTHNRPGGGGGALYNHNLLDTSHVLLRNSIKI